jgi:hypothetical protein
MTASNMPKGVAYSLADNLAFPAQHPGKADLFFHIDSKVSLYIRPDST